MGFRSRTSAPRGNRLQYVLMKRFDYYRRLWRIYRSYAGKETRLAHMPIRLWIEATSTCGLSCVMCPNKSLPREQRGFMDFGLFKKIIDEAKGFVFDVHLLHRGEPLAHPDFFRMIRYAHDAGIVTRFHTNGTLLTEEKSRSPSRFRDRPVRVFLRRIHSRGLRADPGGSEVREDRRQHRPLPRAQEGDGEKARHVHRALSTFPTFSGKPTGGEKAFLARFKGLPLDKVHVKELAQLGRGDVRRAGPVEALPAVHGTFLWHAPIIFWDGSVLPCTQDFFDPTPSATSGIRRSGRFGTTTGCGPPGEAHRPNDRRPAHLLEVRPALAADALGDPPRVPGPAARRQDELKARAQRQSGKTSCPPLLNSGTTRLDADRSSQLPRRPPSGSARPRGEDDPPAVGRPGRE